MILQSNVERILRSTIDGTEYTEEPQSRVEALLLELKTAIEGGGGGGGTTNYNTLSNKPKINGVELKDDKSIAQLGGVQSFNGRNGSILPMAGDYDATQINYDSNQTVKQKIDALVTKEESDIAGQQSLIKDTVGWTGKNLLKNTATTQTKNGVTFTVNVDGSVIVNGTATADADLTINNTKTFKAGSYILNGAPSGSSATSYYLVISGKGRDYGNGTEFTIDSDSVLTTYIKIVSGTTVNNLTFYPMLRDASITDDTYEPYHESVETMYEEEIHGVNLLKNTASTQTINGVTFTVNADKSVTANGMATADASFELITSNIKVNGTYILSGCPVNGSTTTYGIQLYTTNSTQGAIFDIGNGYNFVETDYVTRCVIRIRNGQTVSNLVFKPMLRKADIEDSTYRPYNPQAIQNQLNAQGVLGAKNIYPYPTGTRAIIGSDGTVTANADYYASDYIYVKGTTAWEITGTVVGGNSKIRVAEYDSSKTFIKRTNYEVGNTATINSNTVYIRFCADDSASNYFTNVMVRLASDPDDTYQPHAMTNKELTDVKFDRSEQGVLGAKNLCPATASTQTINGVTFIVNKDSDDNLLNVTVNGTATAVAIFILSTKKYPKNKYILTGCPKGGNQGNSYALQVRNLNNDTILADEGNGISGNLTGDRDYRVIIRIANGYTANNLVFYPMLRLASDPDDTYQPYTMTNRELTDKTKDVAVTEVKSSLDSTYVSSCSSFRYLVKNGICFVYINNIKFTSESVGVTDCIILPNGILPKASIPATSMLWAIEDAPLLVGTMRDGDNNVKISINGVTSSNVNHTWYGGNLIYPIA